MAIIADYTFQGIPLKEVYIRPQSLGGAKNYDWAATFALFANQQQSQSFDNHLEVITVTFPWKEDQNVYADAYEAMANHPDLSNIKRG